MNNSLRRLNSVSIATRPAPGLDRLSLCGLANALLCAFVLAVWPGFLPAAPAAEARKQVLIVVGPSTHPPGSHEVAAGGRLMKHCLENATNVPGLKADVVHEWPKDDSVLAAATTVVFIGDIFPPMRMEDTRGIMAKLAAMMDRGCGLVCVHYATGLRAEDVATDGEHPLLHWMGGYFATRCKHHQSVARIFTSTITPADTKHPVLRGWKAFTLEDEPYYNNYFGKAGFAPNVTPLATAMVPPEAPTKQVVAWCVERRDGGRGLGIVMPHFYRSWKLDDLRTCILNGIVWTAKMEVPKDGVQTTLPDLATFQPESVEPKPRPAKAKAAAPKAVPKSQP